MPETYTPPPRSGRATQCVHKGVLSDVTESVPGYRIPARCKMGFTYYDVRRGDDVVGRAVPSLKLCGRWLELCGFQVGDEIAISTDRGRLVLSRRSEQEPGAGMDADAAAMSPVAATATRTAPDPPRSTRAGRRRGPARTGAR